MPSRILRLWNPDTSAWEEVGDSRLTVHQAAADPHPGYVLESLADAKGDLLAASAADTLGRLPLGPDGQVLTADSTQTLGVRWAAAGAGGDFVEVAGDTMTGPLVFQGPAVVSGGAVRVLGAAGTDARLYGAGTAAFTPTNRAGGLELGVRFHTSAPALLVAVRWWRVTAGQTAPTAVRLYDSTATGSPVWQYAGTPPEFAVATTGFREHRLPAGTEPALVSGRSYTLTYYAAASGGLSEVTGAFTPAPDSPVVYETGCYKFGGAAGYPDANTSDDYLLDAVVQTAAGVAAASGAVRLPNATAGAVAWRNAANTADLSLSVDSSDRFAFTGDLVVSEATPTVSLKQAADTQPRSRLTDTALAFGPGGTTAPDATVGRTGPGALRVDTHLGVGVNPAAWSGRNAIQVGQTGAVWGDPAAEAMRLTSNLYNDGTNNRTLVAAPSAMVSMSNGQFFVNTAPAVAAGAVQALTTRMALAQTGTLTLTPDAGQPALSASGLLLIKPTGSINLSPDSGYVNPGGDVTHNLGGAGGRWIAVYARDGVIVGSSREAKEEITPLDPAACAQAVLDTDWVAFEYKAPPLPPGPPEESVAQSTARVSAHSRMVQETAFTRKQRGYVLGSPSHRTSPLFGLSDRKSASTRADLGVVACALQDALRRIATLEGA